MCYISRNTSGLSLRDMAYASPTKDDPKAHWCVTGEGVDP